MNNTRCLFIGGVANGKHYAICEIQRSVMVPVERHEGWGGDTYDERRFGALGRRVFVMRTLTDEQALDMLIDNYKP